MATEGGIKIITDEATRHTNNLAETFAVIQSVHERAFCTFLNRHRYWKKRSVRPIF